MHELPLVIFTLFMQASVGCLVITLLCYFRLFGGTDARTAMKWVRVPLVVSFLWAVPVCWVPCSIWGIRSICFIPCCTFLTRG